MLCKSLKPLPDKWHGLTYWKDITTLFRFNDNPNSKNVFKTRAKCISFIRKWLDNEILEIET